MNRKEVMKLFRNLHIKARHTMHINGGMTYGEYKEYINYHINGIRAFFGLSRCSESQLDMLWQNLNMASEKWYIARNEIFSAIAH